jgi:hypothetical protein
MFAFPIRGRHIKLTADREAPVFPGRVECILELSPEDIFGGRNRGQPLALPGAKIGIHWDANKGQSWIETQERMKVMRLDHVLDDYDIHLTGGEISISFDCRSQDHMSQSLTLFSLLPLYLSLFLSSAVRVDAFYGTIGDCNFNYEVISGEFSFQMISDESQKELVKLAFETLFGSSTIVNPRILAAIGYLYSAMLISAQSPYSGAFLPEVALNLCKTLDVLFTDSRDKLRQELGKLGFTNQEIENSYVSLTLIRNKLDIAHPALFIPTEKQQGIFDSFVKRALPQVAELLKRVVQQCAEGKYEFLPYDVNRQDIERESLLEQLSKYNAPKPDESKD